MLGRLQYADELAHRAEMHVRLWTCLSLDKEVDQYPNAFENYGIFLGFVRSAFESAIMNRLANLLHWHPDTENIPSIVRELNRSQMISAEARQRYEERIADIDVPFRAVKLIRDNVAAHQSKRRRPDKVYEEASISLNDLVGLARAVVELTGELLEEIGDSRRVTSSTPVIELQAALLVLHSGIDGPVNLAF